MELKIKQSLIRIENKHTVIDSRLFVSRNDVMLDKFFYSVLFLENRLFRLLDPR